MLSILKEGGDGEADAVVADKKSVSILSKKEATKSEKAKDKKEKEK